MPFEVRLHFQGALLFLLGLVIMMTGHSAVGAIYLAVGSACTLWLPAYIAIGTIYEWFFPGNPTA